MRKLGGIGWNVWRAIVGAAYLAAAAFNLFVTLPAGDLSSFADDAWFPALADLVIEVVQPHHDLFVLLIVAFEIALGVLILGRDRRADLGIGASVLWVLLLVPFLQPFPMAATNIVLALAQGVLLIRRYDDSIWALMGKRSRRPPPTSGAGRPPGRR